MPSKHELFKNILLHGGGNYICSVCKYKEVSLISIKRPVCMYVNELSLIPGGQCVCMNEVSLISGGQCVCR